MVHRVKAKISLPLCNSHGIRILAKVHTLSPACSKSSDCVWFMRRVERAAVRQVQKSHAEPISLPIWLLNM